MVGRKRRLTVDYFPHIVRHGRTMFILEESFGNNGYAILFKTFEILAGTEGHSFDFSGEENWLYLCARFKTGPEMAKSVLDLLAKLGTIDQKLYAQKVIWCDHLVSNLSRVYEKRAEKLPAKPISGSESDNSGPEIPQRKGKERKGKDRIENTLALFAQFWAAYPKKKSKGQAEKAWKKIDPETFDTIMGGLEAAKKTTAWRQENDKYIPYPATWLNARGWEDELSTDGVGNRPKAIAKNVNPDGKECVECAHFSSRCAEKVRPSSKICAMAAPSSESYFSAGGLSG